VLETARYAELKNVFSQRYDFIRLLGIGGFAEVYLARDKLLEREVAIKILLPQQGQDPQTVERFLREARLYAKLEHKNIIPIYDTGILEGHVFITMKFIRGESLKQALLSQKRIAPEQLPGIIRGTAQALDYIHRQGIVHRDIKPANIIVERATRAVYLADFGIARAESSQTLTQTGMIVGTPSYLSPEQIKGKQIDARSDLYSLGATLYELAAGEPPFKGDSPMEILYQHINEKAGSLTARVPGLDPVVRGVITRCLEKDPACRFQSAGELLAMMDGQPGGSRADIFEPTVLTRQVRRPGIRPRWLLAALLLCLALAGIYFLGPGRTTPPSARDTVEKKAAADIPAKKKADAPPQEEQAVAADGEAGIGTEKKSAVPMKQPVVAVPERRKIQAQLGPEKGKPPAGGVTPADAASALPGTIRFSSFPPLAEVYYAGEKLGSTEQLFEKKFPPGDHRFTFSIPGYRSAEVRVSVAAGETARAHHRFPPFRSFTITSRPFGRVAIDGVDSGDTPQTVKLAYGDHLVRITKEGYAGQEQRIVVAADTKNTLFFELRKEEKNESQ
jgi:tRNA A-37 threonylcarbamoyl transferase component Bud32